MDTRPSVAREWRIMFSRSMSEKPSRSSSFTSRLRRRHSSVVSTPTEQTRTLMSSTLVHWPLARCCTLCRIDSYSPEFSSKEHYRIYRRPFREVVARIAWNGRPTRPMGCLSPLEGLVHVDLSGCPLEAVPQSAHDHHAGLQPLQFKEQCKNSIQFCVYILVYYLLLWC